MSSLYYFLIINLKSFLEDIIFSKKEGIFFIDFITDFRLRESASKNNYTKMAKLIRMLFSDLLF